MSDSYFPIVVEFTQGKNKGERKFVQSLDEIPNNVSFRVLKTKAVQSDCEESDSMPITGDFSWIKVNRQQEGLEMKEKSGVNQNEPELVVTKDKIRELFLGAGFTIKEGQLDLKPYVYEAADKLLDYAFSVFSERMKRSIVGSLNGKVIETVMEGADTTIKLIPEWPESVTLRYVSAFPGLDEPGMDEYDNL